jgi:hypothetical protein
VNVLAVEIQAAEKHVIAETAGAAREVDASAEIERGA